MHSTTNWLGQELNVGDLVYYGARSGDTTTSRIGRILSLTEKQDKYRPSEQWVNARVQWLGENRYRIQWAKDKGWMVKASTVNADSLILLGTSSLSPEVQQNIADII